MNDTVSRRGTPALWAALGLAFLTLALGWQSLFEPMGRDQGIHASIALGLDHGLITYSDVYNLKPPLTTGMHWLALKLFGHDMAAIRKLDMIVVWAMALGLWAVVGRLSPQRWLGMFTASAALVIYYAQDFWNKAQTDAWAVFCIVGALLALTAAWGRQPSGARRTQMALAGALMGAAVLFKYTLATFGLLVFAPLLAQADARRFLWSDLLFLCLGGLAALLAMAALLASVGALGDYFEIQRYILSYVGYEDVNRWRLREYVQVVLEVPTIAILGLIGTGVILRAYATRSAALIHPLTLLMILSGWMSGAAQDKGFVYHFMPELPGFALAAALGLAAVLARLSAATRHGAVLTALLVAAGMIADAPGSDRAAAFGALGNDDFQRAYWAATPKRKYDIQSMVDFNEDFRQMRAPGETMFLWGYETLTYLLQDEPPRYRYPYAWPLVVTFHDGRYTPDLMERLRADPPVWFLVNKHDETPHVTGHDRDSAASLPFVTPLQAFVDDGYALVSQAPLYDVYERID